MKNKHTPGPWKICPNTKPDRPDIVADCGLICSLEYGQREQEGEANARLIAAAPDLLGALRYIAGLDTSQDASPAQCSAVLVAMNAIAKAEGGAA